MRLHDNPRALWKFVRESFGSFRQLGTFLPAQLHLARKVAAAVPRKNGMILVELGAGEGCLTRAILHHLAGLEFWFLVVELNGNLLRANRESIAAEFPTKANSNSPMQMQFGKGCVLFLQENAMALDRMLARFSIQGADAVVSSLPLFYLSPAQRQNLLHSIRKNLGETGVYVQYRYSPRGTSELTEHFRSIHKEFILNLPPASLWSCSNRHSHSAPLA